MYGVGNTKQTRSRSSKIRGEAKKEEMEGVTKQQSDYIWQDREIRFDSKPTLLACRRGEKVIGKRIHRLISYSID